MKKILATIMYSLLILEVFSAGVYARADEGYDISTITEEVESDAPEQIEEEESLIEDNSESLYETGFVDTGICGDNLIWTLDTGGTLEITGSGEMGPRTWDAYYEEIKKVVIQDGCTSISEAAFFGYHSITSVELPDSIIRIGAEAFKDSGLIDISLPSKTAELGREAFRNCVSLEAISTPATLTHIPEYAFADCENLKRAEIGTGTVSLAEGAFCRCGNLQEISFPESLEIIGDYSFSDCASLENVIFPTGLTSIGTGAFVGCSSLEQVFIPANVHTIGEGVFASCPGMSTVQVDNTNEFFDSREECNAIIETNNNTLITGCRTTVIPDTVTVIATLAFSGCTGLESIRIPDNITEINSSAFSLCGLRSFVFPEHISEISDTVLLNCHDLTYVDIPITVRTIGSRVFDCCENLKRIYYHGSEEDWNKVEFSSSWYYQDEEGTLMDHVVILFNTRFDPDAGDYGVIYTSGENIGGMSNEIPLSCPFENCVFSTQSTQYNPELSYYLAGLSRAAYGPDENPSENIEKSLSSMGFNAIFDYKDDSTVAYSVAKKTLADGADLVLITIRGSYGWSWASNADIGPAALNGLGKHEGFERSSDQVFLALKDFLGGVLPPDATYVITGHSQGAGVGNLLAVKLYDSGVLTSNVYDYNYACPNVACLSNPLDWNPNGVHNNIFNISNVEDVVPLVPSTLIGAFIPKVSPMSTWGKFGQSFWFFPNEENHSYVGHDMKHYVYAMSFQRPITAFADYAKALKRILGIHCPVDAVVYDKSGMPVAGVINNQAEYYDSEFGQVMIFIDGDEKWICLPNDKGYDIRLTATDEGKMKYEIYDADLAGDEINNIKTFESVQLTKGKEMANEVSPEEDASETKLYVIDNGAIVAEVQEDGSEIIKTDIGGVVDSGECGKNVKWELNEEGVLTISGEGAMTDFYKGNGPWSDHNSDIVSIVISGGVTYISQHAFYGCSSLENITIPSSVTCMVQGAFTACKKLKDVYYDGTKEAWERIDIIRIGGNNGCISAATIHCTDGDIVADSNVIDFGKCGKNVTWTLDEEGVLTISGEGAMTDFKDQDLEESSPWEPYNSDIVSIVIGEEVTSIFGFDNCNNLTSVMLSDSVTSIGEFAFAGCNSLTDITIPVSVTSIGDSAFSECSSLAGITIPASVTIIYNHAFAGCSSLTGITIPASVTSIGYYAFTGCSSLADITIPASVTTIANNIFYNCSSLAGIKVDPQNPVYDSRENSNAIIKKESNTLVAGCQNTIIPSDVTSIGNAAFAYCSNLENITIPASVTSIDLGAFAGCSSLTSMTIPASVKSIGDWAFQWCSNLESIKISASVTSIGRGAFVGCNNLTIYGYTGTKAQIYAEEQGILFQSIDNVLISITNATVSVEDQVYSGVELTPPVRVILNGETLVEGTDYSVVYSNNTNVGTATATITGIGDYEGTTSGTFSITPKAVTPTVKLSDTSYTYDGNEKKPAVTSVKDGNKALTKNDYDVKYASGRINAGKYNVTVNLKGNYTGTKTVQFTINKATQSITAKASASSVPVGKTTTITVTGAKGKKSFSTSDKTIATVDTAGKVTMKKVGTVKITVTSAATTNYNKVTKTVTIKVLPAATSSVAAANQATGVKVSWKKVTGAKGYYVYRNNTKIKDIASGSTVSYSDTKANSNGTKYVYKIVAYANTGTSTLSRSVTAYRVARPAISSLKNSAAKKMTVKWGTNAKGTGYEIQYSTAKNFSSKKTVSITNKITGSKVISGLTKGKPYYVRVRTYKTVNGKNYYSGWSSTKSVAVK